MALEAEQGALLLEVAELETGVAEVDLQRQAVLDLEVRQVGQVVQGGQRMEPRHYFRLLGVQEEAEVGRHSATQGPAGVVVEVAC